jgi:hypothetical protein
MGPDAIMHALRARSLPKINFGAIFFGAGAAPDGKKKGRAAGAGGPSLGRKRPDEGAPGHSGRKRRGKGAASGFARRVHKS